ncbi:MAG: UDP-3-O-(3-hydroxymyristoyl)glucosamine N-acyltransferase [Desulfobulbaceae bacterium]|nr:UDP-3-O-(3-hydroxymyristoyl)glucosamine N-acyltransferase [Desulfobulbaceae bacterium]
MARSYSFKELAELVDGRATGDEAMIITGLNGLREASDTEIIFITDRKKINLVSESKACAVIVPNGSEVPDKATIEVDNPEWASAVIHNHFLTTRFVAQGISPAAHIGEKCEISSEVTIGPMVCVGNHVKIGSEVTIHPGVVIGDDVVLGNGVVLHPNVTVQHGSVLGNRVIIHSGTVIGSDGFGYSQDQAGKHIKRPQVGVVHIDDDVEIGANSCVDRAAFGVTRIRRGVKIDNLVQVAHNVDIGEDCILVSQSGIAGSTSLGRHVMIGGGASIAGHLTLEDGVMVAGRGGVHNSQKKGAVVGGYPAFDARKWARSCAAFPRLPDVIKDMRRLRKELESIKTQETDKD